MRECINPSGLAPSAGQSQVVVTSARKHAYLSGQVAVDVAGQIVGIGDFSAQLQCVLDNIDTALAAAGTDRTQSVKLTIFVVDLDVGVHGPVLQEWLGDLSSFGHPAATLVSVAGLARPEFLIEIDVIAAVA